MKIFYIVHFVCSCGRNYIYHHHSQNRTRDLVVIVGGKYANIIK